MKITRESILAAALELYNRHGLSGVSVRDICNKMAISPGNFTYHFKKKDELVPALYEQFKTLVDQRFAALEGKAVSLELLVELVRATMQTRLKFCFLAESFNQVLHAYPAIKKDYVRTIEARKMQFLELLEAFRGAGLFRDPLFPGEYEMLYERIHILGTFWIPASGMLGKKTGPKVMKHYLRVILPELYPYLAEEGRKQWKVLEKELVG